jgi:ribosome biogenesis protein BMS1
MAKRAVILEPEDRKKRALVQALATIKNDKVAKRSVANAERLKVKLKEKAREKAKFEPLAREEKKKRHREEGMKQAKRQKESR